MPEYTTADAAVYGREIADFADLYDRGWVDEVSQGEMVLYDADGDSVRRTISRLVLERAQEGDMIVTKFLSPAEIKGVAALTHENPGSSDDNWLYLPATKRVRRISGANNTASFQGTEFTYEDLANFDPREYDWRFVQATTLESGGASVPVFEVEARATYSDTGYSRQVLFYNTEHWRIERVDYYDLSGRLLKTRQAADWRHLHDRFWRPFELEMVNHQTKKLTRLKQTRYFVDLSQYKSSRTGEPRSNLTADAFTTRALED